MIIHWGFLIILARARGGGPYFISNLPFLAAVRARVICFFHP